MKTLAIILTAVLVFSMAQKPVAPKPEPAKGYQETLWNQAKLRPEWIPRIDKALVIYERNKGTYQKIQKMRKNGVPKQIVFGFHLRESTCDFDAHLHNGDPLRFRTRNVPAGRLPLPAEPPFEFLQSAEDALYTYEGLEKLNWSGVQNVLRNSESMNGFGYYKKGLPSPYLWSGTTVYEKGKYTSDGNYSPIAIDKQIGLAALLIRMKDRNLELPF